MSTPIDFRKLAEPFHSERISWRVGMAGKSADGKIWVKALAYFDARDGMDRLDQVVGPESWQDEYRKVGDAVICRLGICVNGVWVYKEDASDETDIEAVKGGMSGAFKRACVKWGIGRYLYDLKEGFATVCEKGTNGAIYANTEKLGVFYWLPPSLPDWALPESERQQPKGKPNLQAISAPDSDPGAYVIKVGKFKGNRIDACGPFTPEGIPTELLSWATWLAGEAKAKNKPLTGDWKEVAEMVAVYCASRANQRPAK